MDSISCGAFVVLSRQRSVGLLWYRLHRSHTHADADLVGDGCALANLQCGGLGDIGAELWAEFVDVVCKVDGLMAGAGDGNVRSCIQL